MALRQSWDRDGSPSVRVARSSGGVLQESVMSVQIQKEIERAFDLRDTPHNTRATYSRCIGKFEEFFGRPASELGRKEVEEFLLHLVHKKSLSPASHNVYVGSLRFLYGTVLDRPEVVARVPRRKQPRKLPVLLSPAEIERLIAATTSITVRTIVMLAYGAGLRVSEACGLRVEDIDSRSMLLHIRHAKRGRERYVMLGVRLLEALRAYWRKCRPKGPTMFPGRTGNGTLDRATVSKALRRAAERCGITRRVTPHTLRHCFATHLLEQGVDLRSVQVLLGHASLHTTMVYVHVTTARVQRLASPLDRLPRRAAHASPAPTPAS
jgi:integrase/recombinase XerD